MTWFGAREFRRSIQLFSSTVISSPLPLISAWLLIDDRPLWRHSPNSSPHTIIGTSGSNSNLLVFPPTWIGLWSPVKNCQADQIVNGYRIQESPSAWMTANEASHGPALSHRFRFSHGKTTGREEMRFFSFQVGLDSEKLTGRPSDRPGHRWPSVGKSANRKQPPKIRERMTVTT